MSHPMELFLCNTERSSMYIKNNDGGNILPTPLVPVNTDHNSVLRLIHDSCTSKSSPTTTIDRLYIAIKQFFKQCPVIYTIISLRSIEKTRIHSAYIMQVIIFDNRFNSK